MFTSLAGGTNPGADYLAEATAQDARREARTARTATGLMQQDIERLLIITEALWSLMKREHGYTDNELIRVVSEIDLRDGKLDGRVPPGPPRACPHCSRVLGRKRPFCLYCGKLVATSPFER
jgi:hypothetical protein